MVVVVVGGGGGGLNLDLQHTPFIYLSAYFSSSGQFHLCTVSTSDLQNYPLASADGHLFPQVSIRPFFLLLKKEKKSAMTHFLLYLNVDEEVESKHCNGKGDNGRLSQGGTESQALGKSQKGSNFDHTFTHPQYTR